MKKLLSLFLVFCLLLMLAACGAPADVPPATDPTQTPLPTEETTELPTEETTEPPTEETTEPPTEETTEPPATRRVSLAQVLEGSDIRMTVEGDSILLEEDGLTLVMNLDSRLCYRDGFIATVMGTQPMLEGDQITVDYPFYRFYLCGGEDVQPSLFTCSWFFADEVLDALENPEGSAFNRKVLEQTCRPSAFGIEIPNLDPARIFQPSLLKPELSNELIGLGYEVSEDLRYSEYTVLMGGRSLTQAQKKGYVWGYEALKGIDPDVMTVDQFTFWERRYSEQEDVESLSQEQKDFLQENGLTLSDNRYLWKYFYGSQMDQPEEKLRQALETVYQANLDIITSKKLHP